MKLPRSRSLALFAVVGVAFTASACSLPTPEDKIKAAEESAKRSLIAIDHGALEQKVDAEKVKKIQQQLAAIHEYLGEPNGKLDQVTVNAYEAFQRTNDMYPDGMFTDKGLRLLEEAAARNPAAPAPAPEKG
jgi:peptidoglycan hydrolase-like protein with peptidoglycan-binding domain